MTLKSEVFNVNEVRDYEQHLMNCPIEERPLRLKFFINKVGIIRRQLPSTGNENELIAELSRLMENPIPDSIMKETKKLLASDRRERMIENSKLIFKNDKKKHWLCFGKKNEYSS